MVYSIELWRPACDSPLFRTRPGARAAYMHLPYQCFLGEVLGPLWKQHTARWRTYYHLSFPPIHFSPSIIMILELGTQEGHVEGYASFLYLRQGMRAWALAAITSWFTGRHKQRRKSLLKVVKYRLEKSYDTVLFIKHREPRSSWTRNVLMYVF